MFKKINPQTCEKCPHRHDPNGCPCWIDKTAGFMKMNIVTGEEDFITGCFYQVIPFLMIEVVKASNRPAAAVESTRNEMVVGLSKIAEVLDNKLSVNLLENNKLLQIENK